MTILKLKEHPALRHIMWTPDPDTRSEVANYRGHLLRMFHLWPDGLGQGRCSHVGYVDGQHVAFVDAGTVPQICEILFNHVDKLKN